MSPALGGDSLRRTLQSAVGDQYDIIRLLGRGGMGAVYLARDTLTRLVAIKVILPHVFNVPGARERFRREMRTVARFSHPSIVPIYTSAELDDLDYFVMMHVSGDSVAERLKQDGRMPPEEVRRILIDVADALHYAHGFGVIHRDVKPANVMIDDMTGRAYLTDFGVAKSLNSMNSETTGTIAGTMGYIAPETFTGATIDHRADIYSLGVLGFEMITGRRPFVGDHPVQLMQHTLNSPPPTLSALAPDIPTDLDGVLMGCLAKSPEDRPRTARHLGKALGVKETDEQTMPEDLRDMAGFGSWTLLWFGVWTMFGILRFREPILASAFLLVALIVPTGFVLQVAGMRPARLPALQIARVAFWPPRWWGMWWPRRLRRPTDLWGRLPLRARLTRTSLSAFLIVVPTLIFLGTGNAWIAANMPPLLPAIAVTIAAMAFGVAAVMTDAWLWARRAKLDGRQTIRVLIGPTVAPTTRSALWDSENVARLLAQPVRASEVDVRETPGDRLDCVDKIRSISQRLTGRSRGVGAEALVAARGLSSDIELLDTEIMELAEHADSGALALINAEIAALPSPHQETTAASSRRQRLLREQARLRDIEMRLETATLDRSRALQTQHAIWQELLKLAEMAPEDKAADVVQRRVRRLCEGIDHPADDDYGSNDLKRRGIPPGFHPGGASLSPVPPA